jgi:hypothetical protein
MIAISSNRQTKRARANRTESVIKMAKASKVTKIVETPAPAIDNAKLSLIVAATVANGFTYEDTGEANIQNLLVAGLIETNAAMADENGNVATRATVKGIETVNATVTETAPQPEIAPAVVQAATAAPKATTSFAIRSDIPVPTIKRGGAGRAVGFPFDLLEPGQSFHVPATAERPEPAKSLASTVSTANAKYAKETGESEEVTVPKYQLDAEGKRVKVDGHFVKLGDETITRKKTVQEREFVARSVDASDPDGIGARIFRLR